MFWHDLGVIVAGHFCYDALTRSPLGPVDLAAGFGRATRDALPADYFVLTRLPEDEDE